MTLHVDKEITSASNPRFKIWRSLLENRGIKRHGLAIAAGSKITGEVAVLLPESVVTVLVSDRIDYEGQPPGTADIVSLSRDLFRTLDVSGTSSPLFVVRIPDIPTFDVKVVTSPLVLAIPFQDPANVGAVIRSAAAFGVRDIVLLSEAANPFHPKGLRAAGPAAFLVRYYAGPSIKDAGDIPLPCVALSRGGTDLQDAVLPERCMLLPGMEGQGFPPGFRADMTVSIPMSRDVESLNAAVAVSVALFAITGGRK